MDITKRILEEKFKEYNSLYFDNKLTKPKFFFFLMIKEIMVEFCQVRETVKYQQKYGFQKC